MWSFGPIEIKGSYCSMKNARRVVRFGHRLAFIKKEKALLWEMEACKQVPRSKVAYEGPVALIGVFYYDDKRSDLDPNLLMDMIQTKAPGKPYLGILRSDNQIKAMEIRWEFDKENPRVIFALLALEDYTIGDSICSADLHRQKPVASTGKI